MELATKDDDRNPSGGSLLVKDVLSVVTFLALIITLFVRLAPHIAENVGLVVLATLIAYLAADFVSGFFHWMGDTWGHPGMPILGQAFIKPFRDHHVDQLEITRHAFLEVNGNNCFISLPFALGAHCFPFDGHWFWLFSSVFLGIFVTFIFCTNQFHKWSHMEDVPAVVKWLQDKHLILPPAHHSIHHEAPYATHYCITVGWMNGPLAAIDFYRRLERLVTKLTGAIPRESDAKMVAENAS